MTNEMILPEKSSWRKLLIYWHTKNFSQKTYDIALIIAVAVFTDRKIYEAELKEARKLIGEILVDDESGVDEIMHYIEMRLLEFKSDEAEYANATKQVKTFIKRDEQLYRYCIDIFESDEHLDTTEQHFEQTLKKLLLEP